MPSIWKSQAEQPAKESVVRILKVVSAGITMVPPAPQLAIAASMEGTSLTDASFAEVGVQVALCTMRPGLGLMGVATALTAMASPIMRAM